MKTKREFFQLLMAIGMIVLALALVGGAIAYEVLKLKVLFHFLTL